MLDSSAVPERIGPFTIVRRLGAGGMAETFEAVRRGPGGFEQRVCVKRILPAYSNDSELIRLFMREARLAAALSHRNVVRVIELGHDCGSPYLALELVHGVELRTLLRGLGRGGRMPLATAALVAMEIAEALEHAHTRGAPTGPIVHLDVSPANILVSVDGDVKLADFGISKAVVETSRTPPAGVRGNVWYMAPEQLEVPYSPDPRSDLFALGVVLYQCVAGVRPSRATTRVAAMLELSEGRRIPLRESAPDTPAPLHVIVERLLAQSPADRYADAGAVAEALAPFALVTGSRRALRELVRAHRSASAPTPSIAEPVTLPLGSTDDRPASEADFARPAPRPWPCAGHPHQIRPRWLRYAIAPGIWPAASRLEEDRRRQNRPLPRPLSDSIRSPSGRTG